MEWGGVAARGLVGVAAPPPAPMLWDGLHFTLRAGVGGDLTQGAAKRRCVAAICGERVGSSGSERPFVADGGAFGWLTAAI